jgi:hypothetical protein
MRRHGPLGYLNYQSFKPWLRDGFTFRCVYCLFRERWYPNGQGAFSVDHLVPQHEAPERVCDYDDLLYACLRCNSWKQAARVPDPCTTPYAEYLRVREDGTIEGLTPEGARLIDILGLDDPQLADYRRRLLHALRRILLADEGRQSALTEWLGYPGDLPDLAALRPPGGNSRQEGLEQSCYALRQRGSLPETY